MQTFGQKCKLISRKFEKMEAKDEQILRKKKKA